MMKMGLILRASTAVGMALASTAAFAAEQPAAGAGQQAGPAVTATVPADAVTPESGAAAGTASQAENQPQSGLADIVVTAQRRSENLQRAALAISAVPADALVRAGVTDTAQLTRVAPAIQIGAVGGTLTTFYLRGVGNFTANSLSDAAISVNLDGVPIVRSNAIQGLFYDLERVEVLKGPQGTLYGRNATGGAINLLTAKPRAGELSGYLNGEYGNYDAVKIQGAINIPAGERGAFRVAGILSDRDGFYSDGLGQERLRAVRVQGSAQLTDTFRLTAGGDVSHAGGRGGGATIHGLDKDDLIGLTDPRAQAIYRRSYSPSGGSFLDPLAPNRQRQDNLYWGMFLQADVDTSLGTLTLLPSYRNANIDYTDISASFLQNDRLKDEQTTVELRLTSDNSSRFSYLVGGFFLDEKFSDTAYYNQGFQNFYNIFDGRTKSYAGFGRLTYKITDAFRLTGGARYTIDKRSVDIDSVNAIVICPTAATIGCVGTPALPQTLISEPIPAFIADNQRNPVAGPFGSPLPYGNNGALLLNFRQQLDPSKTFKKFTYRGGVEFDVGPQSLLYAAYETGFKAGGFFASNINPVYQPETINAITIGSKNRFFDNKLQVNVEGFWWNYKDQQVSHFRATPVPGQPGATQTEFATENVGSSRVRGIELELRAQPTPSTTLSSTIQYLDAKYRNFQYETPVSVGPPVTGCAFRPSGAVFVVDCSGRQAINAPTWTITGGVEQSFDIANGKLVINVDGRYESSSYKGFEQLETQRQGAYFLGNAQVQYAFPGSNLTIGVFANNFTNTKVVGFSTPHPAAPGLIIDNLRLPRLYGVRAGIKF